MNEVKKRIKDILRTLLASYHSFAYSQYRKLKKSINPIAGCQNFYERLTIHYFYKLTLSNSFFVRRRLSRIQMLFLIGPVKTLFMMFARSLRLRLFMLRAFLAANVYIELVNRVPSSSAIDFVDSRLLKYRQGNYQSDLLDCIRIIEHYELWENYFEDICDLLIKSEKTFSETSWEVAMKVFNELALWGNYIVGEKILLMVRESIESEHPGKIWSEKGLYFSAIGHQSQLQWLIECLDYFKSAHLVELGDGYSTPASEILAKKWVKVAHDAGIAVNQNTHAEKPSYLDLETFPTGNGFELVRRKIGQAHHELKLTNSNTFLTLTENEVTRAEEILSRLGFQPSDSCRLVGLHVRTGSDFLREGRNSTIEKYESLIRKVTDYGDWVVAIGDQSQGEIFLNFENKGMNFINFAVHDSHERELVHLYVWAKSRFMVGNLSGGTMPAMGFNTPILWIDIYPLRHFRPPNELDLVIPKRIIDINESKNVTFNQLFGEFGNYYDSENILLLHSRGLGLVEVDETDILSGVDEMYLREPGHEGQKSDIDIENYINSLYRSVNLAHGAGWSKSFISRHSSFFAQQD